MSIVLGMMQAQEIIPPTGVEELRFVTRTYNTILLENKQVHEKLTHEASHDALTGLFNRGAYDLLMESADTEHMALILVDVDNFKGVNDTYGHAVGDRVLKRVADILRGSFRSVDILCRIGGDEFAVVMTRANSSMGQLVRNKINRANELLQHPKDDLPPVSLSVGVAFSDRENPQGDIFKDADTYKAEYYKYIMNGLLTQLTRIEPGKDIEESHMRNRKFISEWCYQMGKKDKVIEIVKDKKRGGKTYVKVNNYEKLRALFGKLLAEVQRIKSEGDFEAGRKLVETYGVKVDPKIHAEILKRYESLNIAPYKGFVNPIYKPVYDANGEIKDITISYNENYVDQHLRYGRDYSPLTK